MKGHPVSAFGDPSDCRLSGQRGLATFCVSQLRRSERLSEDVSEDGEIQPPLDETRGTVAVTVAITINTAKANRSFAS